MNIISLYGRGYDDNLRTQYLIETENLDELSELLRNKPSLRNKNILSIRSADVMRVYLENGLKPNRLINSYARGQLIHHFCKIKCLPVVKVLVEYGADIDVQDSKGRTPLYWAAGGELGKYNNFCISNNLVNYLVDQGADVNADCSGNGGTILHKVCKDKSGYGVVKNIMDHGGIAIPNNSGITPLHIACKSYADKRIIKLLIDHNSSHLHLRNYQEETPIFLMVRHLPYIDLVQYILDNDLVDPTVTTVNRTTLISATITTSTVFYQYIVEKIRDRVNFVQNTIKKSGKLHTGSILVVMDYVYYEHMWSLD